MPLRGVVLALVAFSTTMLVAAPAEAQSICANFWAQQTGTYGDLCGVTVTGVPVTPPAQATQNTITGFAIPAGGSFTYAYASTSQMARWDFQVVDVDPGEEVTFEIDGVELAVLPEHLITNPSVTAQPLTIVAGRVQSTGADGSAYVEIYGIGATQLRVASTGAGSVIVHTTSNTFCQCANGNKHVNEDCDDGGVMNGDGCDMSCVVEPGWTCTGNPSVCMLGGPVDAAPPVPDATPPVPDAAAPDAAEPMPDAPSSTDADPGGDDTGGGDGGCCDAGGGPGPSAVLAIGVLVVARRRRRR